MHYSTLLFALPLAHATVLKPRMVEVEYDYVTNVVTDVVTVTAGAAPTAEAAAPAPAPAAPAPAQNDAPGPQIAAVPQHGGHGHQHFHSYQPAAPPVAYTTIVAQPSSQAPAPAPAPSQSETAPPPADDDNNDDAPAAGSSDTGGCPADTSGAHLSPGVDEDGNPNGKQVSMIDSMNRIRRMYNPNAACLGWSDSLQQASQQCASQGNEVDCCRANSNVISDMNYGSDGLKGTLSQSVFEGAMFMMLCQLPSDPKLDGQCTGKTGEVEYTGVGSQTQAACSGPNCTGHRDAIIDAAGTNNFMGVGVGDGYMSCSFSKTNGIFE